MATAETSFPVDDPARADPKHLSLEFENEKILVLRAKLGPNEKMPMLSFPPMMTVSLTDRDIKFTLPGGRTQRLFAKAGEAVWYDARTSQAENVSAKPYEGLLIMFKDSK